MSAIARVCERSQRGLREVAKKGERMKKKVAIFGNGWSNEYLELVVEGIRKRAKESNVDLFLFANYSAGGEKEEDNVGEKSIFTLPDISEFDGVILLANIINMDNERVYLNREVLKHKIPAVSLEYQMDGIPYIGTDTYDGVFRLVTHLIEEHGAREFAFVSGPVDNFESQNRMKATLDALQQYGLQLPASNVLRCNWSYYTTYQETIAWVREHEKLPDAFVCANDEMAVGVCAALDMMGIRVPDQVRVTGCDHVAMGQQFYPILSTVAREWDKLGYAGMDALLKSMDGQEIPESTIFSSVPVLGESCGCAVPEKQRRERLQSIIRSYRTLKEGTVNEWHLRHIDETMAKLSSKGDLKGTLAGNFGFNHSFEGSNFLICLVDGYFSDDGFNRLIHAYDFTEHMEVYAELRNGQAIVRDMPMFSSKQLMPEYEEDTKESHLFIFVPLHTGESTVGYAVFKDDPRRLYDQTLYTWTRHVSQDLERVRQNIRMEVMNQKLAEVSRTDALTGLRNRTGFDVYGMSYLQQCQREGKNSAIVFADVNRMKMINDKFGHQQGDLALCTVAAAIKKSMPVGWIAVRYGGDEFIMVGECTDQEEADSIKERLVENLEKEKLARKLVFPLTASFGAVLMHPGEKYSFDEYLRKADKAMYVTKQKYHAADGNRDR